MYASHLMISKLHRNMSCEQFDETSCVGGFKTRFETTSDGINARVTYVLWLF